MFSRIAIAIPIGVAVTAALLYIMQVTILVGRGGIQDKPARVVDFVRLERAEIVETKQERLARPEAPERAPDMPQPDASMDLSSVIQVALVSPSVDFGSDLAGLGFGSGISDGEYLPIVKVAPAYPLRALQRRLEGYVIVEFVVTSAGSVRDVTVVESTEAIFEEPAIEAALKFKYRPRVVDGTPIDVLGVRNKISFKLES